MLSLAWIFYLMVIFFGLIGSLRGWQREVLALTGLIASIAALNQFGYTFVNSVNNLTGAVDDIAIRQNFFRIQAIFHCTVAFFSYQVVARLANSVSGGRLGDRVRGAFQQRFIGAILGAVNGYLLVGGLWSFLEFELRPEGYVQLPIGQAYPFSQEIIVRPLLNVDGINVVNYLPIALIGANWWLLFFFVAFFVVIIALV